MEDDREKNRGLVRRLKESELDMAKIEHRCKVLNLVWAYEKRKREPK